MNKCRNPEHPHCTHWVMQDAGACAGGHAQPGAPCGDGPAVPAVAPDATPAPASASLSSFEMISARRDAPQLPPDRRASTAVLPERRASAARVSPTLHVSGFDPRAAGGRQALRLELRGMPGDVPPVLTMRLKSSLLPGGSARHEFVRTRHGEWPSAVTEFTSRGREHGQYPIEVELLGHRDGAPPRRWSCTLVVLVPRPDATLTDIHQTFLATHRNVRVMADDGSIARMAAHAGGGRLDIDVSARNASIAQLNLDATGKTDLSLPTIAWDEELIETGVTSRAHPQPAQSACLVNAVCAAGAVRRLRLFASDECVLGRLETRAPLADVLLAHHGEDGPDAGGLTRRLSAQHAVLRRGLHGFEIEDISRYGVLVDGVWPGKYVPVALRPGMRIELTASVRNIVTLEVTAVLPHGVILQRADAGSAAEAFYIVIPGRVPEAAATAALPRAAFPLIYHADGGFWHLEPATGRALPLGDGASAGLPANPRFTATAYPELNLGRIPSPMRDVRARRSRVVLAT